MKKNKYQIFIIIILLALVGFIASCDPVKRQARRCATCPTKIERKDSIVVQIKERQVPFAVPGPTIEVSIPNPCSELCDSLGNLIVGFSKMVPTKGGRATVFTNNNQLKVKCESDSLKGEITARDSLIKRLVTITEQVPSKCDKDCLSEFERVCLWVGKITLLLIGLTGIGLLVKRKFLPRK